MDRQLIKQTIADVIHLTPARQAEACYSVRISDQDSTGILVSLRPTLDHLTWTRIGSKDRKALYESMVFHAGLALGNLTTWLDEHKITYTVSRSFPEVSSPSCPNAQDLILKNIEFTTHETSTWIELQRCRQIGVFNQYQYDSTKCHRDMRFMLNALAHDLGYVGNESVCSTLMEYFDRTGNVLVQQSAEIEAYRFVGRLLNDIMLLQAPAQRYQAHTDQWRQGPAAEPDSILLLEKLIDTIIAVISQGLTAMPDLVNAVSRQEDKIEVAINV
jgi:hypothetical protein